MAEAVTEVEEQTYRSPRPGFFVGDEGNLSYCSPLATDEKLSKSTYARIVTFHNINQTTRAVARSLPSFKEVAAFPHALSALIHLEHRYVDLPSLATRLRSTSCVTCGNFGDYVYLITVERVCYLCLRSRIDFSPIPEEKTGLSPQKLQALPHIHTVPGRYGVLARCDLSLKLYDRRQVLDLRGQKSEAQVTSDRSSWKTWRRNIGSGGKPNPLRYMAAIPGPYLNPSTGSFDRGLCCLACVNTTRTLSHAGWDDPIRNFTKEDMSAHIEQFGAILKHPDGTYTHDSPRHHSFWSAPEFDAAVDLCHNYEKITIDSYGSFE